MPIIKSAKKRVKVAAKASARNARTKRTLREAMKAFTAAIESGKAADIVRAENAVMSALDTAVKKDVIHSNKAARQKAKLAAKSKAAGIKHGKTPVKKAPAKTTSKKAAPKKTASKKK
jgi:small subunit ribosomal protein S20